MNSSSKHRIGREALENFTKVFSSAEDMWFQMSTEYDAIMNRDPEMAEALIQLSNTLAKFEDMKRKLPDVEESSKEDSEVIELQNYSFILFTLMKNLEHLGLIKVIGRPERTASNAIKTYEKAHKQPVKARK
jgi:hypothetical protein